MFFLFDIDDTLYDLEEPFKLAFKEMFCDEVKDIHKVFLDFRKYNNLIYEKAIEGEITMEELCIYRAKNAFKDNGINIDNEKALQFQLIYLKNKKYIRLNPYTEKMLELLYKKKITMGIISNGPHKEQFQKVQYLNLQRFINPKYIFVSEDVGFHKPDPKIFEFACNKMNISNEDKVFFVGDSFKLDIIAAKNSGLKAIWLNRRNYIEKSNIYKADFVAYSFEELFKTVNSIVNLNI